MSAAGPPPGAALLEHPIASAVVGTVRARGYEAASVEELVSRAGMTRSEFDLYFSGREEVIALVLEAHVAELMDRVGRAYASVDSWPANLREAGYEIARCMLEQPEAAWFLMVGVGRGDPDVRAARDRLFRWGEELIDAGREVALDPDLVAPSAPIFAVGAVVETIRRRRSEGLDVDVAGNLPWMMYAAVAPYLGEEAARAELGIELPEDLRST